MPVVQEEVVTRNSFLDGVTDTSVKWWGEGVVDIMWVTALDLEWSYAWLTMPLVSEGKSKWSALGSQLSRNPHPPQGSSQADCVTLSCVNFGSWSSDLLSQYSGMFIGSWKLEYADRVSVMWYSSNSRDRGLDQAGFCLQPPEGLVRAVNSF